MNRTESENPAVHAASLADPVKSCKQCGHVFKTRRTKFCSYACSVQWLKDNPKGPKEHFNAPRNRWYVRWRSPGGTKVISKPRAVVVWENSFGPVPDGFEIHHINHDSTDDVIGNLMCLSREDHRSIHDACRGTWTEIGGIKYRRCDACDSFYQDFKTNTGKIRAYCKNCHNKRLKSWRSVNKDKVSAINKRARLKAKAVN